ncbi:restriction endonuclease [Fusobacterium mortiferum]|uniref:restriction endonuclease n=1 Tax=Fusobacterium mortiferum TaxID=850 RepID=UPI0025F5F23A|nr:restriction endonuclease [uncultured Fusobacterium sp.]
MELLFIIGIIIILYIFNLKKENIKNIKKSEEYSEWYRNLSAKYDNLKKENKELNKYLDTLIKEENIKIEEIRHKNELERLKKEKEKILFETELKKELASYKINETMNSIFEEYTEKKLNYYEEYFRYKPRPSIKTADYIKEIKSEYKRLEKENRELNLLLSQFIIDEELNIKQEKEERSFDVEEKAYKYGRLPKEQWDKLTYIEKLDVVLERYQNSWKDKLNIGLEFERYCGYLYERKGYQVKYCGILNGKADGGIDLVAKSKTKTLYIQCKYWGTSKTIRENTISQLFGSALKMALDNGETYETFIKKIKAEKIRVILLTKTEISEEAKTFCEKLNVIYQEKIEIKQDYPRVKLVYGEEKIFYIPTDLQYDNIAFGSTNKDYSRAFTCKEAEEKGYRHCYKWRGN